MDAKRPVSTTAGLMGNKTGAEATWKKATTVGRQMVVRWLLFLSKSIISYDVRTQYQCSGTCIIALLHGKFHVSLLYSMHSSHI